MDTIKSKENSKIKYVRSLNSKKGRDEQNAFIVEGIKFVNEAIKENTHIMYLIFSEKSLERAEIKELSRLSKEAGFETLVCDDNVFSSAADTINSQGVLAVIRKNKYIKGIEDHKFAIFCDRIQDPGNLGTIIRTADAFGPAAVILNKGCVDAYNSKVVRASAGAIFRANFIQAEEDEEVMNSLLNSGYKIISTVVDSNYSFEDIESSEKICIVIGNEGQGVSREIIKKSHMSITIKMSGRAESLNASIAAGISIYEIRKKLL